MRKRAKYSARLLCGTAMAVVTMASAPAWAQNGPINIEPQPLASALREFASQSQQAILVSPALADNKSSKGVQDATNPELALAALLEGTGLTYRRSGEALLIVSIDDPQSGSAAGDGADGTVEALIVTAQKREEDIQDVPIAISAFTQEQLENSQIAGGPDLMTQVPNFTFTKTNFSSYSIQIRGIGTQAISATTDPAVAIAFNNTPFIRNRFFEQEFYDLQRVEVLRGPQGTLYGRNATAGVVNIISNKASFGYEAKLGGDVANYNSTRLEGMINLPLVDDVVALRLAGAWTKREGFVTNEITGNPIDGRDLWSTRVSLRFSPNDRLDANLIWEHFEEDDDRLRSGKQLCNKHVITRLVAPGENGEPDRVVEVDYFADLPDRGQAADVAANVQSVFSQGCAPASLYAPESFQTPNGMSIPYYYQLGAIGLPRALQDPYVSEVQSRDLRMIESTVDPEYRAKTDVIELQMAFDLTDTLSLNSETAWASDFIFSMQDFNRFNTAPGAWSTTVGGAASLVERGILTPDGFYCDPQIGCANRLVAIDLSTATSRHFSQEFRLASNYDGDFNFSLGANFLRYDTEDKYYVFINSLGIMTASGAVPLGATWEPGVTDGTDCLFNGPAAPDPNSFAPFLGCMYIDPNPIDSLDDQGHNYFLSKNPYKLISYAVFGEGYYSLADNLKVTAGLRWTVDKKEAPRIPSWLLAGGTAGYPVGEVIEQEWREPTGRLTIDWKPDLAFTDETLLYASYAHGYKAGGANPPPYGIAIYLGGEVRERVVQESATSPKVFDPEFVDAFEVGAKNTLLDGRLTFNANAFYYDYKGYQISQIVDRSAVNLNFDAEVWGVEIEADWRPLDNLRLGFKGGYENTRVADGEQAIDTMDRTAGMPGWSVIRPFPSIPSNCILPTELYMPVGGSDPGGGTLGNQPLLGLGSINGGGPGGCEYAYLFNFDPGTEAPFGDPCGSAGTNGCAAGFWRPDTYPGFDPLDESVFQHNHGQGFFKDLSGNELPNAPNYTATITADYTIPLPNDWLATLHTDLYYQSEAWTRIFNTEGYDKLKAYTNVNLAAIFTNEDAGWKVMAYVKNVFDRDSITGAFLNSDDTGLTTNVFLTEPRLYGLRVTKEWRGGSWFDSFSRRSEGPYPFIVELGGQVQRTDAPNGVLLAGFEDDFPDSLNIFADAQNRDLDWGDGREARLIFRPGGGWSVSAGVRYGKTNSDHTRLHVLEDTEAVCGLPSWHPYQPLFCSPSSPYYDKYNTVDSTTVWSASNAWNHEEHQLIDFAVGKDIGIGGLTRSTLSAGIRYAQFESQTTAYMGGVYDRQLMDGWIFGQFGYEKYQSIFHSHEADLQSAREFEGTGPVLSWDAAVPLLGNKQTGRLHLDWSISGGALFGEQQTVVEGSGEVRERRLTSPTGQGSVLDTEALPPIDFQRSEDVTVPVGGASLGLSYAIDRINIGAGYRWERYFDVLDSGFDEKLDADRTIDGPYFKLSVGFGG